MTLRSGRKVGERAAPREAVPPRERVASKPVVVPSKATLWKMGCRVTFPLVELAAEIERCASPSWEQLKDFLYRFTDIDEEEVTLSLASGKGLKVYAYSVEWRTFIDELVTKVRLALDKSYVAFLNERGCGGQVLETEPGTPRQDRAWWLETEPGTHRLERIWWNNIIERHSHHYKLAVMFRARGLPGYVRESGQCSVRKAASGAGF